MFSKDEIVSFENLVDAFEDGLVKQAAEEEKLWHQVKNPDRRWWQIWKPKLVWVKREPEPSAEETFWQAQSSNVANNVYARLGPYELNQEVAPVRITYGKR